MATVDLQSHALESIDFIRQTMQKASAFTAVPGRGGVVMGVTALGAWMLASRQGSIMGWLLVWFAEAIVALAIGGVGIVLKSRRTGEDLASAPARKFLLSFTPPMALGAVLTFALWEANAVSLIPGVWLTLYGVGVMAAGAFSVPVVPGMGLAFLVLGCLALIMPDTGEHAMVLGFGVLHIVFGIVIARRYGG